MGVIKLATQAGGSGWKTCSSSSSSSEVWVRINRPPLQKTLIWRFLFHYFVFSEACSVDQHTSLWDVIPHWLPTPSVLPSTLHKNKSVKCVLCSLLAGTVWMKPVNKSGVGGFVTGSQQKFPSDTNSSSVWATCIFFITTAAASKQSKHRRVWSMHSTSRRQQFIKYPLKTMQCVRTVQVLDQ